MSKLASSRYKRAKAMAPVTCDGIIGRLENIGRGGLAFSVSQHRTHFQIDESYQLNVKLPRSDDNPNGVEINLPASVRHLKTDETKKRLMIGVQFGKLEDQIKQDLHLIVLHFARKFAAYDVKDLFKTSLPEKNIGRDEIESTFNRLINDFDFMPAKKQYFVRHYIKQIQEELNFY